MDRVPDPIPGKVGVQYGRFFQTLGINDGPKVQMLARLLKRFYVVAKQLDNHLAPVGATVYSAVSRMVKSDNPRVPPQHRWIRIVDRLEFFGDADDHASRVVNVGLSYAYRHQEVHNFTAFNAVCLSNVRPDADNGVHPPIDDAVLAQPPPGGIIVADRRPGAGPLQSPIGQAGGVRADGTPGVGPPPATNDDATISVPLGCVVVRRHGDGLGEVGTDAPNVTGAGPAQQAAGAPGAAPPADTDSLLQDGSIVIARRSSGPEDAGDGPAAAGFALTGAPAAPGVAVRSVIYLDDAAGPGVSSSQPLVTPSVGAINCVNTVLEEMKVRQDVRGVLEQLVIDSLLCFSRLHSGAAVNGASGLPAADDQLSWKSVRKIAHRWWPVWEGPASSVKPLPPPGTVSYVSHPCRAVRSSKWAIEVDTDVVVPVAPVPSEAPAANQDSATLPRGARAAVGDLAARTVTGQEAVDGALAAGTTDVVDTADAADYDEGRAASDGDLDELSMLDRYNEMEQLLAQEKESEAAASRSRSLAVRRLSRPMVEPARSQHLEQEDAAESSTLPSHSTNNPPTADAVRQIVQALKKRRVDSHPPPSQGSPQAPRLSGAEARPPLHLARPRGPAGHVATRKPAASPGANASAGVGSGQAARDGVPARASGHSLAPAGSDQLPSSLSASPPNARAAGAAHEALSSLSLDVGLAFPSAQERAESRRRVAATVAATHSGLTALAALPRLQTRPVVPDQRLENHHLTGLVTSSGAPAAGTP